MALQEKLSEARQQIQESLDRLRDSEAVQQLRSRYDELDTQKRMIVQALGISLISLLMVGPLFSLYGKSAQYKAQIKDREETITYLNKTAEAIRLAKATMQMNLGDDDTTTPLNQWVEQTMDQIQLDRSRFEVSAEKKGAAVGSFSEITVDIKMNQINLRQLVKFMYQLSDRGKARGLFIRDMTLDNKPDNSGYLEGTMTVVTYRSQAS